MPLPPPAAQTGARAAAEAASPSTSEGSVTHDSTEAGTTRPRGGGGGKTTIRAGAIVAVALAAAFVTWLVVRDDGSKSSTATTVTAPASTTPATTQPTATSQPKAVTEPQLRSLAADRTVYWAGPAKDGQTLTFTEGANGTTYVRYLPAGVTTADPIPPSLVVATYPMKAAYAAVKRSGKADGSVTTPLDGGGLSVYATARPTNVYFSYPKSPVQVEVYDPSAGRALELVTSGTVAPIAP
jgi:hypothetical protein